MKCWLLTLALEEFRWPSSSALLPLPLIPASITSPSFLQWAPLLLHTAERFYSNINQVISFSWLVVFNGFSKHSKSDLSFFIISYRVLRHLAPDSFSNLIFCHVPISSSLPRQMALPYIPRTCQTYFCLSDWSCYSLFLECSFSDLYITTFSCYSGPNSNAISSKRCLLVILLNTVLFPNLYHIILFFSL